MCSKLAPCYTDQSTISRLLDSRNQFRKHFQSQDHIHTLTAYKCAIGKQISKSHSHRYVMWLSINVGFMRFEPQISSIVMHHFHTNPTETMPIRFRFESHRICTSILNTLFPQKFPPASPTQCEFLLLFWCLLRQSNRRCRWRPDRDSYIEEGGRRQ